jgi:hypothetical protein
VILLTTAALWRNCSRQLLRRLMQLQCSKASWVHPCRQVWYLRVAQALRVLALMVGSHSSLCRVVGQWPVPCMWLVVVLGADAVQFYCCCCCMLGVFISSGVKAVA